MDFMLFCGFATEGEVQMLPICQVAGGDTATTVSTHHAAMSAAVMWRRTPQLAALAPAQKHVWLQTVQLTAWPWLRQRQLC